MLVARALCALPLHFLVMVYKQTVRMVVALIGNQYVLPTVYAIVVFKSSF